jgi:signal transduction histidine kinase
LEIIFEEISGWKVEIKDFGKGTSGENEVKKSEGNGLRNMRARADMVGWEITWSNNTPGGTVVTICPDKKQKLN